MNEGDVVTVFSQLGEIVDCYMVRDKDTGEPKGFCFVAYEDQRSTDLAVDNFNGIDLCGRKIKVDHCHFRVPKEFIDPKKKEKAEEDKEKNENGSGDENEEKPKLYVPSGPDGKGWGEFRKLNENDLKNLSGENQKSSDNIVQSGINEDDNGIEKTPVYNQPEGSDHEAGAVAEPKEENDGKEEAKACFDDDEKVTMTFLTNSGRKRSCRN